MSQEKKYFKIFLNSEHIYKKKEETGERIESISSKLIIKKIF